MQGDSARVAQASGCGATYFDPQNAGGFESGETISVTEPAGGTGVQKVAMCVIGSFENPSASTQVVSLQLGNGGTSGPILLQWEEELPGVGTFR
jgi:hypothetical protein